MYVQLIIRKNSGCVLLYVLRLLRILGVGASYVTDFDRWFSKAWFFNSKKLFFWSDKPPWRANSAHVACSQAGTWAAWAEVARWRGVSYVDKIYILKSSWKIVRNINHPAKSDEFFLRVGTPNVYSTFLILYPKYLKISVVEITYLELKQDGIICNIVNWILFMRKRSYS